MVAEQAIGALGLVSGVLMLVLAGIVIRSGPTRVQNRLLALGLFAEGVTVGGYFGLNVLISSEDVFRIVLLLVGPFSVAWPLPYVWLAVLTLDTPLTRPLRAPAAQRVLLAVTILIPIAWVAFPAAFMPTYAPIPGQSAGWVIRYGPGQIAVIRATVVVFLLTIVASIWAYRRARTGPERARAKAFARAFVWRDSLFIVWALYALAAVYGGAPSELAATLYLAVPAVATLGSQALITYGILQAQLFDIHVRIHRGISRGTVAAVFVALYVAVSQATQAYLEPDLGPLLGLLAAAALVLAISPLQQAAERLASAIMPGVDASPRYLSEKRLEVYRQALLDAHTEGRPLGPRDEAMLARLREALGITDRDHAVLDYSVRASLGSRPGGATGPSEDEALLGRYRLRAVLGEGSFARTYLADDTVLGRAVVVKDVAPDRAGVAAVLEEARAMARVRHPNVVTIFDVDRVGERAFIVMEHADGGSLKERVAAGPLPPHEFWRAASGLLAGLEAVHDAGMVHRDVKPANVLLTAKGEAKLADFGVAHIPGFESTIGGAGSGGAVGTVRFMSPEQAKGRRVTAQSDLFSAAATLYEAWTGRPWLQPAPGESAVEVQMRAARAGPYEPGRVQPPPLDRWFMRALAPAPEDRFRGAREMREALESALAAAPA